MPAGEAAHLNLDDAWPVDALSIPTIDARSWGPRLRMLARWRDIDQLFHEHRNQLRSFTLYGSGDFHHLTAALLRRFSEPLTVVCFDNHPDWDIRPPRWSCGGWVNRALELSHVQSISVWGCGNFELAMPSRIFGNTRAVRQRRLQVHAWAERQSAPICRRFDCMTRESWRDRFDAFADQGNDAAVYISVDLDCLNEHEVRTNWETGLFTAADVAWAIDRLRGSTRVIGGDVCGAYSAPRVERMLQQLADWWDHPKLPTLDSADAQRINVDSLKTIWTALAAPRPLAV